MKYMHMPPKRAGGISVASGIGLREAGLVVVAALQLLWFAFGLDALDLSLRLVIGGGVALALLVAARWRSPSEQTAEQYFLARLRFLLEQRRGRQVDTHQSASADRGLRRNVSVPPSEPVVIQPQKKAKNAKPVKQSKVKSQTSAAADEGDVIEVGWGAMLAMFALCLSGGAFALYLLRSGQHMKLLHAMGVG